MEIPPDASPTQTARGVHATHVVGAAPLPALAHVRSTDRERAS